MNEMFPLFLFLGLGSIGFFSFLSVAIWAHARRREREAYYKSERVKKIAEMEETGAVSAIELFREEEKSAERRRGEGIKLGGLVSAAIGVGLMVFLRQLKPDRPDYLCGLLPLFIGLALLVYVYGLARNSE